MSQSILYCQFFDTGRIVDGEHVLHCNKCNRPYRTRRPNVIVNRMCGVGPAPELPWIGTRLLNFSVAAIGHAAKGFPTCTDEQIQERLEICRGCKEFKPDAENPELGACAQCGCPVSNRLSKFVSKLAWADQQCPLRKWPAISDSDRGS